jgi:hypothetical protein
MRTVCPSKTTTVKGEGEKRCLGEECSRVCRPLRRGEGQEADALPEQSSEGKESSECVWFTSSLESRKVISESLVLVVFFPESYDAVCFTHLQENAASVHYRADTQQLPLFFFSHAQ